jgi:hypothetical protein
MATTTAGIDAPRHDAARDTARFLGELRTIVGRRYVLTNPESTHRYRTGVRFGTGPALAVVHRAVESAEGLRRGEQESSSCRPPIPASRAARHLTAAIMIARLSS